MKKYELLAPVGNFAMLIAMREAAKNFKISNLSKIRKICGKNVKIYLTLNTIIYNNELKRIEKRIKK